MDSQWFRTGWAERTGSCAKPIDRLRYIIKWLVSKFSVGLPGEQKLTSDFGQNAFAANLIYYATIMFVKLSILFLYLRTFTESRIFRHAVQAVMAVIISSHVAIIFILRYTVTRMDCHWRGWVSDEIWDKECHINISYNPLASVLTWISALTVVLDVIIMILPCRAVWRLHLPQRQKLAILITLLSGVV